jgi:translocation and assembly module TamB
LGKSAQAPERPHGAAIPASGLQIQAKLRAEKIRYLPAGTAADQGAVLRWH